MAPCVKPLSSHMSSLNPSLSGQLRVVQRGCLIGGSNCHRVVIIVVACNLFKVVVYSWKKGLLGVAKTLLLRAVGMGGRRELLGVAKTLLLRVTNPYYKCTSPPSIISSKFWYESSSLRCDYSMLFSAAHDKYLAAISKGEISELKFEYSQGYLLVFQAEVEL